MITFICRRCHAAFARLDAFERHLRVAHGVRLHTRRGRD